MTAAGAFSITKKLNEAFKACCEITVGLPVLERNSCIRGGSHVSAYRKSFRSGKLIVDPKAPVIDCRVVDYSPGGACLEVSPQVKLPTRFELLFGTTRKRCRVVWSAGRRLGVAF